MADQTLITPDLVGALIDALNAVLDDPVVNIVPSPRPDRFVRLDILGGAGRISPVASQHTITYEAWAATNPDAYQLAAQTCGELHRLGASIVGNVLIYRVDDTAAPGDLPDPDSAQARMVGTVGVTCRLAPA